MVDIAAQLGHNPTVCLDTYAHVMAEQRGAEPVSAEREILMARGQTTGYSQETPAGPQLAGAPECGVVRSTSACRTLSRRTRDMPMS